MIPTPLQSRPLPLDYEHRRPRHRIWPAIAGGLGMILFIASATTPFLFRMGEWVLPAGGLSLVLSGLLIAVADRY